MIKAAAAIALLVVVALFGREAAARLPAFAAWVQSLGVWGPLAFIAGYGVAAVLLIPGVLLTFAAGALWGLGHMSTVALVGATCLIVSKTSCMTPELPISRSSP